MIARSAVILMLFALLASCNAATRDDDLPTLRALTPDGTRHYGASWSPDGKRVAYWKFAADTGRLYELWTANADMGQARATGVRSSVSTATRWSPDGSKLTASSTKGGASLLTIVPLDGRPARVIEPPYGLGSVIMWHPHGDRVAVLAPVSGGRYASFVYSLISNGVQPMVPDETKKSHLAAWSPDGSRIVYFASQGERFTLWTADSVGKNPRPLTTEGFETFSALPSPFSPDGKFLYNSRRTGASDLWILPPNGGAPRQLTRDIRQDFSGVWSDDGNWIAFNSTRGGQSDLWLVPAAGGIEQRITDTPLETENWIQWRPHSTDVSFVQSSTRSAIWRANLASGEETQLTADSLRVGSYKVSPDGTRLVFSIDRGGGIFDVAIIPAAGGRPRVLASGLLGAFGFQWAGNGSTIVFASSRSGTQDIWTVDTNTGELRQLTDWKGLEYPPTLSKDGRTVWFHSDHDARVYDVWRVPVAGGTPVRVTRNGASLVFARNSDSEDVFVDVIDKTGKWMPHRMKPDGTLTPLWTKSLATTNSYVPLPHDSVVLLVEQPDGIMRPMMVPLSGNSGRVILGPGERAEAASVDGRTLTFSFRAAGEFRLGLLDLKTGAKRLPTKGQGTESGSAFAPDGTALYFTRTRTTSRIMLANVSKLTGR